MSLLSSIRRLCLPAWIYLVSSLVTFALLVMQNMGHSTLYTAGPYTWVVPSVPWMFVGKAVAIVFWTWVMQTCCRAGYPTVSWILLLFPFFALLAAAVLVPPHRTQKKAGCGCASSA